RSVPRRPLVPAWCAAKFPRLFAPRVDVDFTRDAPKCSIGAREKHRRFIRSAKDARAAASWWTQPLRTSQCEIENRKSELRMQPFILHSYFLFHILCFCSLTAFSRRTCTKGNPRAFSPRRSSRSPYRDRGPSAFSPASRCPFLP